MAQLLTWISATMPGTGQDSHGVRAFDEMVDPRLSPEALIFRLFNSMEPHVAPAREVRDKCRCSPNGSKICWTA